MEKVPMGPPPSRSLMYSAPLNSELEPNSEPILITAEDSTAPQVEVCQADAMGTEDGDVSQQTAPPEVSLEAKEENGCPLASKVSSGSAVPYSIPPWSNPPGQPFNFEVLKEGKIVEKFDVSAKGAYMFGRVDLCDFVLEHPTISRFHAVLQFNKNGEAFLYDVGSTHGTFINKNMVKKKVYTEVHVGDVIRFGRSSRLYIFQGPAELMPPEGDLNKLRRGKMQQELQDREDSIIRAKVQASLADGISWGMAEDAIEESNQNDEEEVTWQSFKGQLTERQEKTRSKIIKRMEKVANMKKEIDSIRVKDISQGGLTQGQQTQIARNEQRISQIMEELDSLEETLNESIQESIGAKNKKFPSIGKKNQEEDEYISDDDEFYDRTKKSDLKKTNDKQSVETADSLLDKKDAITKEMEEKRSLLQQETVKSDTYEGKSSGEEDVLDAYMAGLSSNLARDKATKIQNEICGLQSELDRIVYLLQIADPSGEAAKKRTEKSSPPVPQSVHAAIPNVREHVPIEKRKASTTHKLASDLDSADSASTSQSPVEKNDDQEKRRKTTYSVVKPQWLGAKQDTLHEEKNVEFAQDSHDAEGFIDYKDRKKVLAHGSNKSCIEEACSGLIIRKEKHMQNSTLTGCTSDTETISSLSEVEKTTTDAMALLLKHKRGYVAEDDDMDTENKYNQEEGVQQTSKPKRVLGPEKPAFLDDRQDFQSWVPPEGQVGDGRTALNEKFGY